MKKLTSAIPAAIMILILAGLLFFMCLPQNQSPITSVDGVLDLRGEEAIAPLHGEWEFIYGELLAPVEFAERQADTIGVPGSWDSAGYPLKGCATYRLTVLTDERRPLTLFLPETPSAYVLWINGEPARSAGTVSAELAGARPLFENALVPARALDGAVELVLQVANYHYIEGGITGTILFGESGDVQSWFIRTRVFSAIALGCILMAAFYHLTLYIFRRREKTYLLFALLCFLCFARFLFETNGLAMYFQWLPMNMAGLRLYMSLYFLHSIAIVAFSLYIFQREFLSKYRTVLLLCFAFVLLLHLFIPMDSALSLIIITVTALPLSVFTVIMAARSSVLRENNTMRLYFAALIAYAVIGTVSKLFLDQTLFMTGLLTNMFMVMSQCMVLSRRYTDAFRFVEETNANLEQIVAERTQSLQVANNAMKELVTNISHDLKTPLHVMGINLETLSGLTATRSDAVYQRHVRVAYQKNLDLQRLIRNLFEVSRIETDRNVYAPQWEPILSLLAQAKEKYDAYVEDHGIAFEVNVEDDVEISIDPQKIWSVFDNIMFNAVRHTENGGSITMTAHNTESSATITLADTGCGIAPEHLPHIFDRFYKGSQERSANEGESGLGLYIVKSIMEGCGGSAGIESEPGKGTSIILTFHARNAV